MKQVIKHFLKTDLRKIIIFIIVFLYLFLNKVWNFPLSCLHDTGEWVECNPPNPAIDCVKVETNWSFCILNTLIILIISYFISCFLIWIYDRFKGKS